MYSTDAGHTFLSVVIGANVGTHERQWGFQRALPLAHDFRRKSSVLCLSSDWREKLRCRLVGGAVLSDRKTGRDFRAVSEKFTPRFHKEGKAYNLRLSSLFANNYLYKLPVASCLYFA